MISHDKGQSIRTEDAITVIRALGQNPSLRDSQQALLKAGISAKSSLTYEELKLYAENIWNDEDDESFENLLYSAFKRFDKNQTGLIDFNEFRKIMLNYGEPLSSRECDELMTLADVNHDGKISYLGRLTLHHQKHH